ncbi:hypothetical protein AMAG_16973 [Allomyces macrogynus ATCC 38327]|uniref:Succinate dehydrogenase assembly factor 2, mitochondrial n=1 Tax=Allomyces macrogynus (strain ATCC 38327) TaxID=578462 RepID=A0A0L0TD89_ALLM3|nr:hypothetical protein AMAG_16973 [Allomyces macrogynus ATCC 38327]|eukprot:KNE72873.1 hypothetical protein AMAG_16973 [Allomyces macrogynus ATCC 38327]
MLATRAAFAAAARAAFPRRTPAAAVLASARLLSTSTTTTPPPPPKTSAVTDPWDMHPPMDMSYTPPEFVPAARVNEPIDAKRRRLLWHSRKRGILECDLLLSTFAAQHLSALSADKLDAYDELISKENDWDIYYWATLKKPVPDHVDVEVMRLIQQVAKNEARKILKMPELAEYK